MPADAERERRPSTSRPAPSARRRGPADGTSSELAHLAKLPHDRLLRLAALGLKAGEILHEFAIPITVIRRRLKRLERAEDLAQDELTLRELNTQAEHLHWLLAQATTILAHGTAPGGLVSPAPADLTAAIQDAVRTAGQVTRGTPVVFEEHYCPLPPVALDLAWFRQAVLAVLRNAVEALEGAGAVRITTGWRSSTEVEVAIEDTGPGIPVDALPLLFMPLNTHGSKPGIGLGLHMCHEIVTAHGGRLEVSTLPGHGTTVRIVLPTQAR